MSQSVDPIKEWRENIGKLNFISSQLVMLDMANKDGTFDEQLKEQFTNWQKFFSSQGACPYRDHLLRRYSFAYAYLNLTGGNSEENYKKAYDSPHFHMEESVLNEAYETNDKNPDPEIEVINEQDIRDFMELTGFYYCNRVLNVFDEGERDLVPEDGEYGQKLKSLTKKLETEKRFDEIYVIRSSILTTWLTYNVLISNDVQKCLQLGKKADEIMREFYDPELLPARDAESTDEVTDEKLGEETVERHSLTSSDVPEEPLTGDDLLARVKELGDVSKVELVLRCGYVRGSRDDDPIVPNYAEFYEALLDAKGVNLRSKEQAEAIENHEKDAQDFVFGITVFLRRCELVYFLGQDNDKFSDEDSQKVADALELAKASYARLRMHGRGGPAIYLIKQLLCNLFAFHGPGDVPWKDRQGKVFGWFNAFETDALEGTDGLSIDNEVTGELKGLLDNLGFTLANVMFTKLVNHYLNAEWPLDDRYHDQIRVVSEVFNAMLRNNREDLIDICANCAISFFAWGVRYDECENSSDNVTWIWEQVWNIAKNESEPSPKQTPKT